MRTRNAAAPLAAVVAVLALVPAGPAGAGSTRWLIGAIDGRTARRATTFSYSFDVTHGRVRSIYGSFTCPGNTTVHEFQIDHFKTPIRFAWGRRARATLRTPLRARTDDPHPGSVTVTFTATVVRTEVESPRSGRARGAGTMRIRSARCDVRTTAWRGTGNYEPY